MREWQIKSKLGQNKKERSNFEEEIKGRKAADIIYHITTVTKAERQMWKMILVPMSLGEKDGGRLEREKYT